MGKLEVSFGHHLHQITEAELVAQILTHAQEDHLAIKEPPCKQLFDVSQPVHRQSSITQDHSIRRHLAICTIAFFCWWSYWSC
jgi:hypothetical protein